MIRWSDMLDEYEAELDSLDMERVRLGEAWHEPPRRWRRRGPIALSVAVFVCGVVAFGGLGLWFLVFIGRHAAAVMVGR